MLNWDVKFGKRAFGALTLSLAGATFGCGGLSDADLATTTEDLATGPRALADGVYHLRQDNLLDVPAASGVLTNDTGPAPLSASGSAITGGHGTYSVSANGSFQYQPGAGYFGSDFFNYTLTDGAGRTASARVRTVVAPTNASATEMRKGFGGFEVNSGGFLVTNSLGYGLGANGDVNGDGLDDFVTDAACYAPGVAGEILCSYVVFGKRERLSTDLATLTAGAGGFVIRGELSPSFQKGGHPVGDVNGDGLADVLLNDWVQHADLTTLGKAFVMFGKSDTNPVSTDELELGHGGFAILQDAKSQYYDDLAYTASAAGDVNGDGLADVMVLRFIPDVPSEIYVVFGKADTANVDVGQIRAGIGGFVLYTQTTQWGYLPRPAAVGDVNDDGLDDVVVSDYNHAPWGGESYVVFGKTDTAPVNLPDVLAGNGGFGIQGTDGEYSGFDVAGAGDVNADGFADIVLGSVASPHGNYEGAAYVVFGKATTELVHTADIAAGDGGFMIAGAYYSLWVGGGLGAQVSGAGDVNGDGLDDVVTSAATIPTPLGGQYYGGSYVAYGKSDGAVVEASALALGQGGFLMNDAGGDVGGGSDLNGDGFSDVLLHDPHPFDPGISPGRVYALFGGDFTAADAGTLTGTLDADLLVAKNGSSLPDRLLGDGGADTLLGDGGPDTLLGGSEDDRLTIGGADFLVVNGGGGYDTLALRPNVPSLSLDALRTRQVRSIERIELRNGTPTTLSLSVLRARRLPRGTPVLTVNTEAADTIHLVVGAATKTTQPGSVTYALPGFALRINGAATIVES